MKYPVLFALLTALCWGLYGPTLGQARTGLGGSPFKPYVAIGIAYLIWGIIGGIGGMQYRGDDFSFSGPGVIWGFAAGSLGAWGALTLTLAMFSGGGAMPHIVMPIVFGGAVTVQALVSTWMYRATATVNPMMWVGVVGMGICIVIVAANTPHHAPKPKMTSEEEATPMPH
ncbi:MAG: hypothetical protein WEB58_20580 [Planctomycetaceae bacterium]